MPFELQLITRRRKDLWIVIKRRALGFYLSCLLASGSCYAQTNVFDVTQYGARGDNHTDNQFAINATIAAAAKAGGGVIFFPAGNFLHSDILVFGSNMAVKGSGASQTVIKPTNRVHAALEFVNAQHCAVSSLRIVVLATKRLQSDDSADIAFKNSSACEVTKVDIDGSASAGILIHASHDMHVFSNHIDNTMADGVHAVDGSYNIVMEDNVANNTGDDSFAAVAYAKDPQTHDVAIRRNISRNSHARGATCIGAAGCVIESNQIFSPRAHGIAVAYEHSYNTHHPRGATVVGNTITGAATPGMRGILVDGADDVKLSGNTLRASNPVFVHASTNVRPN